MKLMAIKGLIMSMDDQLYQYLQKDNLSEKVKKVIVDKYYDAINEQLDEPEKKKEDCPVLFEFNIIINGKRHVVHTSEDKTIDWENIVLLSELAKTGAEILTVTFTYDGDNIENSGVVLEVNTSIEGKEGMIFNVKKEN